MPAEHAMPMHTAEVLDHSQHAQPVTYPDLCYVGAARSGLSADRLALAIDACLDGRPWLNAREETDAAHARPFVSLPQNLTGQLSATSLCNTVKHSLLFVSCVFVTVSTAPLPL